MRHRLHFVSLMVAMFLQASPAQACPYCKQRPQVWAGIFNESFFPLLLQVSLAVPLLIAIGLAFQMIDRGLARASSESDTPLPLRRGPVLAAGVLLGSGLGGFLDGIFLHNLLQWHNLIAERVAPTDFVTLEINMFWDGIFNLGMWLIVAVGLAALWRAGRRRDAAWSGRLLVGGALIGWGIFQLVDSLVFHWVFRLHHVILGSPNWLWWDLGYFAMGLALAAVGWLVARATRTAAPAPGSD